MPQKDTDEILEHCCVPNAIIIRVSGILGRTFLECLECHCVVDVIKELT